MSPKRYYLSEDTSLVKKLLYLFRPVMQPVGKFPRDILFETVAGCNARCAFCPNGNGSSRIPAGRMEWDLFTKIADEIAENPVKRISPYLMNEPLLDRSLGNKIRYIAQTRRGNALIKLNTNASLLDEEMAQALISSGLHQLNISCHGISKQAYEESMRGLHLETTLANIDRFLALRQKSRSDKPRVVVTMVKTKLIEREVSHIREYWETRGVVINMRRLENRANAHIGRAGLAPSAWSRFSWCHRPFTQANILTNGDMVLCCVDYGYTTVLGNVGKTSIREVWNSDTAKDIRRRFLSGRTEGLLCHSCMKQTR